MTSGRFGYEGEDILRQFILPEDLRLSPEEYVARHAHEWGCFSLHLYNYNDPLLGKWIRTVGELLYSHEGVERCRDRYLSAIELAEVKRRETEEF